MLKYWLICEDCYYTIEPGCHPPDGRYGVDWVVVYAQPHEVCAIREQWILGATFPKASVSEATARKAFESGGVSPLTVKAKSDNFEADIRAIFEATKRATEAAERILRKLEQ